MPSLCLTLQAALALVLLLGSGTSLAANMPSGKSVDEAFKGQWQAKLCLPTNTSTSTATKSHTPAQPHIEFSFHGPITETFGPLCYHFAGYNETCLPPQQRWLTPATTIELIAPGQVPVELLQGYILLVRFPWLSDDVFRYPLANTTCLTGRSNNSS